MAGSSVSSKTEQPIVYDVRDIRILFAHCRGLVGDRKTFFCRSIELLQKLDTTFLEWGPYPQPPDPKPLGQLNPSGQVNASILCLHPLLEPANLKWKKAGWEQGGEFAGKFGNGVLDDSFRVNSASPMREDFPDFQNALQDRVVRFLKLFEFLVPHVKPRFGYVDDVYGEVINDKQVNTADLKKLFWVTWFGPQYLEKHGREFFLDAPVYQAKELEDGVLVRVTEKWWDFAETNPKEALDYFRQKFARIRANRCVI
jgi:hypothetical protein